MNSVFIFGNGIGILIIIVTLILFGKKSDKSSAGKATAEILPFIGGASIFACIGISFILNSLFTSSKETVEYIIGSACILPLIITIIIYINCYIREVKLEKLRQQEQKLREW